FLRTFPDVRADRIGLVGFCWGGEMTFAATTQVRGLKGAVVFYGRSPQPLDLVKDIQAPVLAHYRGKDPTVNQRITSTAEAMQKSNTSSTYKSDPGVQQEFHADNNLKRSGPDAAEEAWAMTLDFFRKQLQA